MHGVSEVKELTYAHSELIKGRKKKVKEFARSEFTTQIFLSFFIFFFLPLSFAIELENQVFYLDQV